MLHLLGFTRFASLMMEEGEGQRLHVFVRTNKGVRTSMSLDPHWNIGEVKQKLAVKLLQPVGKIKIVFAGRELADGLKLSDCDIGQQSTLHAIQIDLEEGSVAQPASPSKAPLLDLQLSSEEKEHLTSKEDLSRNKATFYVFCNDPCGSLQPGKLRVRCSDCLQGAILFEEEPSCWRDVLETGRIKGYCQSGVCNSADIKEVSFYFKCANHLHVGEDETPPLNLVRSNLHQLPCLACGEENCDPVIEFECQNHHVLCISCFQLYCLSRLNERQFVLDEEVGYTLGCPARCENSMIKCTRHFKLIEGHDYERYQRFGAEECVLQAGGVLCPQPQCGMGLIPDDELCRRIVCTGGCDYVFCRDCRQGYHIGECSAEIESQDGTVNDATNVFSDLINDPRNAPDPSRIAIRLLTKPCPRCHTPTERDGGCMHMICTQSSCGFQWCWICQDEWTRDCMASHWFS